MTPQWHAREIVDVLRWLRAFNTDRLVDKQPYIRHARELARLIE
jgi:erythromycin esterase-like protein